MHCPKTTTRFLRKNKSELPFAYRWIFFLFQISAIFSFHGSARKKVGKFLSLFINLLLTFAQILTLVSTWSFMKSCTVAIAVLVMTGITIIQRWVLIFRIDELKNIAKCEGKCDGLLRLCVIILSSVGIWLQVGLLVHKLGSGGHYYNMRIHFFGFSFNQPAYDRLAGAFYEIYILLFHVIPMNTFPIYYVMICHQIRKAIKNYGKKLLRSEFLGCEAMLRSYISLKSGIDYIDDRLCFLVLGTTVYSSCAMYFSVSAVLHQGVFDEFVIISTTCLFVSTFTLFVAMTVSASLVVEASAEVSAIAWRLLEIGTASICAKQRFLCYLDKEVSLTVWKIVPIKRNFIVGTIGAIFTYVVLFDGLLNVKNSIAFPAELEPTKESK